MLPINTKRYVTGYLLILIQYLFRASSMLSFGDEGIKKDTQQGQGVYGLEGSHTFKCLVNALSDMKRSP